MTRLFAWKYGGPPLLQEEQNTLEKSWENDELEEHCHA